MCLMILVYNHHGYWGIGIWGMGLGMLRLRVSNVGWGRLGWILGLSVGSLLSILLNLGIHCEGQFQTNISKFSTVADYIRMCIEGHIH